MKINSFPEVPVDRFVILTKREAVSLISMLTAQLAGVPAPGCQSGACFEGVVNEPYCRYHFSVEPDRMPD